MNLDDPLLFRLKIDDSQLPAAAARTEATMARVANSALPVARAFGTAGHQANTLMRAFDALNYSSTGLLARFAVGAAGFAFVRAIKSAAGELGDLSEASRSTGTTVERLSALEAVFKRSGGTLQGAVGILSHFNEALREADGKDGPSRVFRALGLDLAELRKLDPAEALQRTAQAFARYRDDGERAHAMQLLLKGDAREAAPLFRDLADSGKVVATATKEQADQAERLSRTMLGLRGNVSDLSRSFVTAMLPSLNQLAEELQGVTLNGSTLLATLNKIAALPIGGALADKLGKVASSTELQRLEQIRIGLENIKKADEDAGRAENRGNSRFLASIIGRIEAHKGGDSPFAALSGVVRNTPMLPSLGPLGGKGGGGSGGRAPYVENGWSAYSTWSQAGREEVEWPMRQARIAAEEMRKLNERAAEFGQQLLEQTASVNASMIVDDEARARAQLAIEKVSISSRIEAMGLYPEQAAVLQGKAAAYILARERQLTEELKPEIEKRLELYGDFNRYMKGASEDFEEGFVDGGRDAFREWVRTGRLSADNLAAYIRNKLADTIYDQFLAKSFDGIGSTIWSALTGWMGGGWGGGGAPGADLSASFDTSLLTSPVGRAGGGKARPWSIQEVNERGPELLSVKGRDYLMMGSGWGTVTPAGETAQRLGGRRGGTVIDASTTIGSVGSGVSRAELDITLRNRDAKLEKRLRRLIGDGRI